MSTPSCESLLKLTAAMQLLAERLEIQEQLISRDFASSLKGVISELRSLAYTSDAMWKSLTVLHDRTSLIAQKVESIMKLVNVPKRPPPVVDLTLPLETNCLQNSSEPWPMDDEGFWAFLNDDPAFLDGVDLRCTEQPVSSNQQSLGLTLKSDGTMDLQVSGSQGKRMKNTQMLISKIPEQSGGMGTSSNVP